MINDTEFLEPILHGTVHLIAVSVTRSGTERLWDVKHRDAAGRLCALTRITIAIR